MRYHSALKVLFRAAIGLVSMACLITLSGSFGLAAPLPATDFSGPCPGQFTSQLDPTKNYYGLTGPTDQDHNTANPPAADANVDNCYAISFTVPKVRYRKPTARAWGALVLTFNAPIDGASFFFAPNCTQWPPNGPNSLDGVVNGTVNNFTQVQLGPGGYGLGQTGSDAGNGEKYGSFIVTVMYDAKDSKGRPLPVPKFVPTKSFWQSKPFTGPPGHMSSVFTIVGNGTGTSRMNPDQLVVPEPSFMVTVLVGCLGLFAFRKRRTG